MERKTSQINTPLSIYPTYLHDQTSGGKVGVYSYIYIVTYLDGMMGIHGRLSAGSN